MSLFVKFLSAGTIVAAATWCAVQGKTTLAALIGVFPFITLLTILFTYFDTKDLYRIELLAGHFGVMLIATAVFPLGLSFCLKQGLSLTGSILIPVMAMVAIQLVLFHLLGRGS